MTEPRGTGSGEGPLGHPILPFPPFNQASPTWQVRRQGAGRDPGGEAGGAGVWLGGAEPALGSHQHRGRSGGVWPGLTSRPDLPAISGLLGFIMELSLSTLVNAPRPRHPPKPSLPKSQEWGTAGAQRERSCQDVRLS